MTRYARPTKQFSFIGRNFSELESTQKALLRRSRYSGTTFDDGVGSQSKEVSEALQSGSGEVDFSALQEKTAIEREIAWSEADGVEIEAPTYLTLTMEGQDFLIFKIGDEHEFNVYSNTRNLIDVSGKIKKV